MNVGWFPCQRPELKLRATKRRRVNPAFGRATPAKAPFTGIPTPHAACPHIDTLFRPNQQGWYNTRNAERDL